MTERMQKVKRELLEAYSISNYLSECMLVDLCIEKGMSEIQILEICDSLFLDGIRLTDDNDVLSGSERDFVAFLNQRYSVQKKDLFMSIFYELQDFARKRTGKELDFFDEENADLISNIREKYSELLVSGSKQKAVDDFLSVLRVYWIEISGKKKKINNVNFREECKEGIEQTKEYPSGKTDSDFVIPFSDEKGTEDGIPIISQVIQTPVNAELKVEDRVVAVVEKYQDFLREDRFMEKNVLQHGKILKAFHDARLANNAKSPIFVRNVAETWECFCITQSQESEIVLTYGKTKVMNVKKYYEKFVEKNEEWIKLYSEL